MVRVKQLSAVFARVDVYQRASRMLWHPRSDVIDLFADYHPAVVGLVVLGHRSETVRFDRRSFCLQVNFASKSCCDHGAMIICRLHALIDRHASDGRRLRTPLTSMGNLQEHVKSKQPHVDHALKRKFSSTQHETRLSPSPPVKS